MFCHVRHAAGDALRFRCCISRLPRRFVPIGSVHPAAGSPAAAGPCFARIARARRALAPARFVRLIAHARRRPNFPRSFPSRGRRTVPDFSGLLPDAPFGPVASLCGRRPAEPPEVSCFVMFAMPPAMPCGSVAAYRASLGVSFRSGPSIPPPRRTRRTLQMAALAPPPAARRGGTLFRAYRVRAPARVGAGAVRAPDCARETADALLPSPPAGFFFGPSRCPAQKSEKRPRKPPLCCYCNTFFFRSSIYGEFI